MIDKKREEYLYHVREHNYCENCGNDNIECWYQCDFCEGWFCENCKEFSGVDWKPNSKTNEWRCKECKEKTDHD